jgi:hypothetical protein
VDRRDPEVRAAEWALDDGERHALTRQLDRVRLVVVKPWGELLPTTQRSMPLRDACRPCRALRGPAPVSRTSSLSASASLMRSPARHETMISALTRSLSGHSPAHRMAATISSTVGGSAGYRRPSCVAGGRSSGRTAWPARDDGRPHRAAHEKSCCRASSPQRPLAWKAVSGQA